MAENNTSITKSCINVTGTSSGSVRAQLHMHDCRPRFKHPGAGPNELSFCTPDVIAPMMGASDWDGQFADQKEFRSLVGLRNPQAHARLRRIWSRGFTPGALRSYQPILNRRVDQLLEHLAAHTGETVDLAKWISWFAIGLVTSTLPWLADFTNQIPGTGEAMKQFREFSRQRVLKRLKNGSATKDIFYYLMDEGGLEATPPHVNQVASDASLVIVAGSDTVAPALSSLFHYLICNPAVYSRLQAEVDSSGLSADDVTGLANLSYLTAKRNAPPDPSITQRKYEVAFGGNYIPEGTTTNVHNYTLQRDARSFSPLPESFIPERWLTEEEQLALEPELFRNRNDIVHNVSAFIPFSYGPADCIGKRFAMQELRVITYAILQRFSLDFATGYDRRSWEAEMCDYFVIRKAKLPVVLTFRSNVQ
ncbi:hypothetical protein H0H87_009752 [Tephrocybe sp. NHM501043]|nr:hypothetical protein H0H87_009752 [Tephrocybe sp. NHM501043]